jgi:hypothetical protein
MNDGRQQKVIGEIPVNRNHNMKTMVTMLVSALTIILAGCASNTGMESKSIPVPKPPITWAEVSQSNDLGQYARFIEAHPGEHVSELRILVEKYLQGKVAEAEGQGKKVVHNAAGMPWVFLGNGATMTLGSVYLPWRDDAYFFSDPTDMLTLRGTGKGTDYVSGKGIATVNLDKTVYCFGF